MKTIKLQFKSLILFFLLMLINNLHAQKDVKSHNVFVRVYNLGGEKIDNGMVFTVTDSLLILKNGSGSVEITANTIGFIKTKRSGGKNILIGALSGAVFGAFLGAASADPNDWLFGYTSAEGAIGGAILGGGAGVGLGAITILFKKSETYAINGDKEKLKVFKQIIENKGIQ